jgi:hypothetical protein
MSIKDKLEEIVPTKAGKGCGMCNVLDLLGAEDKKSLIEVLSAPANGSGTVTNRQVADILSSEGYEISHHSVMRHRQNHMDKQ